MSQKNSLILCGGTLLTASRVHASCASPEAIGIVLSVTSLALLGSAFVEIAILKWFTRLEHPVISGLVCLMARIVGVVLLFPLIQILSDKAFHFSLYWDWLAMPIMILFLSLIISLVVFNKINRLRGLSLILTTLMTTSVFPVIALAIYWGFRLFGVKGS